MEARDFVHGIRSSGWAGCLALPENPFAKGLGPYAPWAPADPEMVDRPGSRSLCRHLRDGPPLLPHN